MQTRTAVRDAGEFDRILRRVKAEFIEMPGLRLTRRQAAKLWALDDETCEALLAALIDARFLTRGTGASFVRA